MKKVIFLAIILAMVASVAYAEEVKTSQAPAAPVKEATPAAEGQEAYGEVASVDANTSVITITEYDYEKDQDINKTYNIDKAATYENVASLAEIKAGDWVALTLKSQKDGTNIASSVYVERYDLEEAAPAKPAAAAPAVVPAAPVTPSAPAVTPAPAATETAPSEETE